MNDRKSRYINKISLEYAKYFEGISPKKVKKKLKKFYNVYKRVPTVKEFFLI
jgi:hypothetical protein